MGNRAGKRNTGGRRGGKRRMQIIVGAEPRQGFAKKRGKGAEPSGIPVPTDPITAEAAGPGRNDPCPCGSGKKSKVCCGPDAPQS